jgi:hypothetical protein
MNTKQSIYNILASKPVKVELGKVQDITELYLKAKKMIDDANTEKSKLASMYSKALIILELNIDAQVENALKAATELGADDIVQQLNEVNSKAKKLASSYTGLYNSLK